MMDFVNQAAAKLGISPEIAKLVTGHLLGLIQQQVGASTLAPLLDKLPGAAQLLSQAGAAPPPVGGGLLGGLSGGLGNALGGALGGALSNALGGQAGSLLGLASVFGGSGVGMDQAGPFVSQLVSYMKERAGAGAVDAVIAKVPELKSLLG